MLLRKRRYELRFGEEKYRASQSLPTAWKDLLKPGDRISMDALVEKPRDETVIVCPACTTWIANRSEDEEVAGWLKWCDTLLADQQQSHSPKF